MYGWILIIIGLTIRVLAIKKLKGRFSNYLLPQADIETSGMYSKVRHPSYTGTILMLLGMVLLSTKVAIMALAFYFFLARSYQEELMLMGNPKYAEYIKKTKRFIPWLI